MKKAIPGIVRASYTYYTMDQQESFIDTATVIRNPTPGHISSLAQQILAAKSVLILQGAGVSVASGIPDYRSPNGLFAYLKERNINMTPEQALSIEMFRKTPQIYHAIEKTFFLGLGPYSSSAPTPNQGHLLAKSIDRLGKLSRVYTQNVDGLQAQVLDEEKLVEFHGSRRSARCITKKCRSPYDISSYIEKVKAEEVPICEKCRGLVKCDIVMYGEQIDQTHYSRGCMDISRADLVIVMGTSLEVYPFKSLLDMCRSPVIVLNKNIPRTYPGFLMPRTTFILNDIEGVCKDLNMVLTALAQN